MYYTDPNKLISSSVDKLNDISTNDFIYTYDSEEKEYYIIHKIGGEISSNNELARKINDVLYFDLFKKGVENVFLREDEEFFNKNHKAFSAQTNTGNASYKKMLTSSSNHKLYKEVFKSGVTHAAKSSNNSEEEYKYMYLVQAS